MVDVRLFADLAEAAGERVVEVEVPAGGMFGTWHERVFEEYPAVKTRLCDEDAIRRGSPVAVDGVTVESSTALAGDELALYPPVPGG